jgi:hypothetical protein
MEDTFKSLFDAQDTQEAWSQFVIEQLRQHCINFDERNKTTEIKILTDYYVQLLNYGRDKLHLTLPKLTSLLVVSHSLIHYNYFNISHSIHSDSDLLTQLKLDFDTMKSMLMNSNLNKHEIIAVCEYLGSTYFRHYRLYNYIFTSKQTVQTKYLNLIIDEPISTHPLSNAVQRLKVRNNEKTDFSIKEDLVRSNSRKLSVGSSQPLSKNPSAKRFPPEIPPLIKDPIQESSTISSKPKKMTQDDKLENTLSLSRMKFHLKLENRQKELMEKVANLKK